MHVKCEWEGHTNNNRPTGKRPQHRITEKCHRKKEHMFAEVIPTLFLLIPPLMKLKHKHKSNYSIVSALFQQPKDNITANINKNKRKSNTLIK
jgi:hypothetical protein